MNDRSLAGHYVSTQTAAMLTGKSARTVQRWQDEKILHGVVMEGVRRGAGGVKLMLDLDDLAPHIPVPLDEEKKAMMVRADGGEAEAMNEVGLYFYGAEQYEIAIPWFEVAAGMGHADAMELLSTCHLKGLGVEKSMALGLKWLGEAAAHGHVIAKIKLESITVKA